MSEPIAERVAADFCREFMTERWDCFDSDELPPLVAKYISRALAAERRRIRDAFRREVLHGGVQWASVYTSKVMRCVRAPRAGRR